jgi:curved DNA-binding protein CbpA
MITDPYEVLGVPRDATSKQVKAAYRKLAKQHHPDACPGDPEAAARFREITDAYEILSDPARREAWDREHPPAPGATITDPADTPAASRVLTVLESIWKVIRYRHPEIPPVVIIIASGTGGKQAKWGHHAPGRWHHDNAERAEVMISGEGLGRTAREILGTLLHEATHALADARGISDTSRQGRYHNRKFVQLADELGLHVEEDPSGKFGWTITTVPDATAQRYDVELLTLEGVLVLWRSAEHDPATARKRDTNLIAATCPCGRTIRVAASALREAPITCQACRGDFEPKNSADA